MPGEPDGGAAPAPDPSLRAGVTAIVVTHNSSVYVERCLAAVSKATDAVVVVDNASTDGGADLVRSTFPAARLIELERNAGFAAACNAGARHANSHYLLFVNPDAWPIGPAVSSLVSAADADRSTGLIGPALVNEDGSPQRSVFGYPRGAAALLVLAAAPAIVSALYGGRWLLSQWIRRRVARPRDEVVLLGRGAFLSGAALLARTIAFEDVGGFDERFFFFSEEADLCFRMAERGWSIAQYPGAAFMHVGGASSPASGDWRYAALLQSYLLFLAKHQGVRRTQLTHRLLVRLLAARAALTPGEAGRELERAVERLRSIDLR